MRRAAGADLPAIRGCLGARPELALFPLSNLARFGFEGTDPHAPAFWVNPDGPVTDVLTVTRNGTVLPFLPGGDSDAARQVLSGRRITALIGPAAHTRPLVAALGLAGAAVRLDRDEPHYALDLDRLAVPDGPGRLVPLAAVDRATLVDWRRQAQVEALGAAPDAAGALAEADIARFAATDDYRVLVDGETPLAMTGFNARLPGIVQIGAVFTPPALRRRGHARRAVALHLAEVRRAGVRRAALFAATPGAARAYEAIGFRRIGDWTLILLAGEGRDG